LTTSTPKPPLFLHLQSPATAGLFHLNPSPTQKVQTYVIYFEYFAHI
jgi:hypothetical protein